MSVAHIMFVCRCSETSYNNSSGKTVKESKLSHTKRRKMSRDEDPKQSHRALTKNLICPFPYKIKRANGFGDLLSRWSVHVGARDGVENDGAASSERRGTNLDQFVLYLRRQQCKSLYRAV
jgi:hypothetical protein